MAKALSKPKSLKAQITRSSLVIAAAALLRERGPEAVTYRKVAEWAGAASASVGYYFDSRADLLYEAGCYNIEMWIGRAEHAAKLAKNMDQEQCRRQMVNLIMKACLPDDPTSLSGHYAQLIAAKDAPEVTEAYRKGSSRLNAAVSTIVEQADVPISPELIGALVDGAAVRAISEGLDVRETVEKVLEAEIALVCGE